MANDDPYTEPVFIVHVSVWRYVVRESNEADGCCAVHYEEDVEQPHAGKTVRKGESVSLGEPKSARAVAEAILKWCDAWEAQGND